MKFLLFVILFFFPIYSFADFVGIVHPPLQVNDNGSISYGYFYLLTITGPNTLTNPNDGTLTLYCTGIGPTNYVLLEDGSYFLLEDGGKLIIEP